MYHSSNEVSEIQDDKKEVEEIVRSIARSFSGEVSTKDWTDETIWFDAAQGWGGRIDG